MFQTLPRLLVALLSAATFAGCGGAPDTAGETDGLTPDESAPALTLGFTADAPTPTYVPETSFALATVTSIRVVADWANVTADQAQRLELRGPSGLVYYATTIPFTGATGSDRSVTPLEAGGLRVVYVLEVAGTSIETYAMTGTWQVTATLDGTATAETATFVLE